MSRSLPRIAQFAAVAAILALAGVQLWPSFDGFIHQIATVAGACAALLGIAAGEFAASARHAPTPEPPPPPEPQLKDAMDRVQSGVRAYLEDNVIYRRDLESIDAGLAAISDPARARAAIADLRAANHRIEQKSAQLNEALEAARREVAALRETVEEVERAALFDALTQVGNRRFFERTTKADMAACMASGADLCLALADIDRFKVVNDRFGPVVGDHLLKIFAQTLTAGARGRAKTARYGGEEFALLMPGVAFPEARRIVEGLRAELEKKRWVFGPNDQALGVVTASFGLAKMAPGESYESFVHRAESRLTKAKSLGRNRVVAEDGAAPARLSA